MYKDMCAFIDTQILCYGEGYHNVNSIIRCSLAC